MTAPGKLEFTLPVRLTQDVIHRADALVLKVGHLPEFALSKPSRSSVLRLAILRGLPMIDADARRKDKPR